MHRSVEHNSSCNLSHQLQSTSEHIHHHHAFPQEYRESQSLSRIVLGNMGDTRTPEGNVSHNTQGTFLNRWGVEQEFEGIFEEERATNTRIQPEPDDKLSKPFASAIDDIMKGRMQGRRVRPKPRLDKAKQKSERKARPEKTPVNCEKCGAKFACVGNLNRHRRVAHQGVRVHCNFTDCQQVSLFLFNVEMI